MVSSNLNSKQLRFYGAHPTDYAQRITASPPGLENLAAALNLEWYLTCIVG